MGFTPTYSNSSETGTNAGLPIWIVGAAQPVALEIICTGAPGATGTVLVESNSGPVSDAGVPQATSWIDETNGGLAVLIPASGVLQFDKKIPLSGKPSWRTRVSVNVGITVSSFIPYLITINGQWVNAGRPPAGGTFNPGY